MSETSGTSLPTLSSRDARLATGSRKGQSRFLSAVSARLTFETPSLRQIFLRD